MPTTRTLGADYQANLRAIDEQLRIEASFDLLGHDLMIGGRRARLYFIDGFVKDEIMEKIMEFLMALTPQQIALAGEAQAFADRFITYVEADLTEEICVLERGVLSGTIALLVEGYTQAFLIDARTYPGRSVAEPEDDRVLRGSRDGFVETLVHNTAMIRRRIRDPQLTMEILSVGSRSQTDVVLCYIADAADPKLVEKLRRKLGAITIPALTMSQESLAECILRPQWFNPFPRVRYTERPDAATASLLEGSVVLLVDNSPSAMILPTTLLSFVQDTNDYYFPPLVGSYLRLVRMAVYLLTIFLTPVWYLLLCYPQHIPPWLSFIQIEEPNQIPVLLQLLIIEFVIDGLKLASLNTPSVLSNSFSVVGALILGDFAVKARWFVPEVVLYMAFVAIATFTSPSFELGYAFKLFRIVILLLTGLWGIWGFGAALVLLVATLAGTKTISGYNYLYPLIPFDWPKLRRLLSRRPISRHNS